ncbi:hypothetical protein GQ457_13G010260 [Hibiscus cannabinus]
MQMVDGNGEWDWRQLEGLFPRESLERIVSVQPPHSDGGEDQPFWRWESNGQFSARSAYGYLSSDTTSGIDRVWRQIWKLKVPYRVRMFAWLALHERLLTNVERVRRHMTTSEHCEICGSNSEDIDHVLCQCTAAKEVWLKIVSTTGRDRFFRVSFREWLQTNLFELFSTAGAEDWHVRFIITCWLLWKRRCCFVFESARGAGEDIIARGNILVAEARRAFYVNVDPCGNGTEEVCWVRPPLGWIKVNVDAAVSTVDGSAGIGVVFRDTGGRWLFGFARFVERCTVLVAELWAIHDGLAQAWMHGHRCVELKSDNLEAVRIVNSTSNLMHEQGLVLAIKRWLRLEWRVRVQHVPRGKNRVADNLAAKGRRFVDYMTVCFATVPDDVVELVTEEMERSITERVCPGNLLAFPYDPGGDS